MRHKISESGLDSQDSGPALSERHYTISAIAQLWGLSKDSVRRLFKNEPGVIAISPRQRRGKRAYVTLRIPASVVERVYRKMSLVMVLTK
jgi:hypothetical protein